MSSASTTEHCSNGNPLELSRIGRLPKIPPGVLSERIETPLNEATSVQHKSPSPGVITIASEAPVDVVEFGIPVTRPVPSIVGSITVAPSLEIEYPAVVVDALTNILREYNQSFRALVAANQEHPTDYRFLRDKHGEPFNLGVQIDMRGLTPAFLRAAQFADEEDVRAAIKSGIFEIENSLAAYGIISNTFSGNRGESNSLVHDRFRDHLEQLRRRHDMPVALLACTQEKYDGMLGFEFGRKPGEVISDAEVHKVSGFDRFFSPAELRDHLRQNNGESGYLLYARTSEPIAKLRKPLTASPETILEDSALRKVIREYAITLNIDSPQSPLGSAARINDTKAYLPVMGMAFHVDDVTKIDSPEFLKFVTDCGGDARSVIRAKPMQSSYGCYGHLRGETDNARFRKQLDSSIRQRGPYVLQLEKVTPQFADMSSTRTFNYIDRVFFGANGGEITYFGGVRTLSPSDGVEVKEGRIHGSATSIYAPIV
jgi:hypothetical protein